MSKSLNEIYKELNELRKLEDSQENYNNIISKSKLAKQMIDNNKAFIIEGTEEDLSKYIESINKAQRTAESKLINNLDNKVEESLSNLFKDYLNAIELENKDGFIKHDVIMKIEVNKGYSLALDLLLKKISKDSDINVFQKYGFDEDEEQLRIVFMTMTSKNFIKVASLIKEEKSGVNFMPQVSMLCVDTKKRNKEEHNEALLSRMVNYDDRENLPYIAERVGYFSNRERFNWYTDNYEKFLKTNFINSYNISRALHNEKLLKSGNDPENYILSFKNIEFIDQKEGYRKVSFNPFTDIECNNINKKDNTIKREYKI